MIYALIILHVVDAVLTWLYGRNTEFGILFVDIIRKGFWWFWACRTGFAAAVVLGCEWYAARIGTHLYWGAIGAQGMVIYMLYAQWVRNKRKLK